MTPWPFARMGGGPGPQRVCCTPDRVGHLPQAACLWGAALQRRAVCAAHAGALSTCGGRPPGHEKVVRGVVCAAHARRGATCEHCLDVQIAIYGHTAPVVTLVGTHVGLGCRGYSDPAVAHRPLITSEPPHFRTSEIKDERNKSQGVANSFAKVLLLSHRSLNLRTSGRPEPPDSEPTYLRNLYYRVFGFSNLRIFGPSDFCSARS